MRNKYLVSSFFGFPIYVLLLFFGLNIWKPVGTKDLILILIVILLEYLETRTN